MTWSELLTQFFEKLSSSLSGLTPYIGAALLSVVWIAWWLWAANWKKFWPALAEGAWLPVLLLAAITALVATELQPGDIHCLGLTVSNGWWQAGIVVKLMALALFCGWLQGYFHWTPHDIRIEPLPHGHGHHHGHH